MRYCHDTINFDFTQYVDSCFRRLMSDYLPLSSLIDAVFIYLVEGIKAVYRMTYSITKIHKNYIKTISDPAHFIEKLGERSKQVIPKCHGQFLRFAFRYPLGTARRHKFSQQ